METINDAGLRVAKRVAWRVSTVISISLAILALGFLAWNSYFRVVAGVQAISGQLTHLLTVGDSFQLKTQLLSLATSGTIDRFQLLEPGGTILAGSYDKEGPEAGSDLNTTSFLTFRLDKNGLHLVRKFDFPISSTQNSVLVVEKNLHLEIFFLIFAIQLCVFYLVLRTFRRIVLKFASDLTGPIEQLAGSVIETSGYEELESNHILRGKLRYLELNQTLDSFLKLLARLHTEEKLRLKAEKDATFTAVAAQVAHDVRSPLSALNMVTQCITNISEDERLILRTATQRINDIANELLSKSKAGYYDVPISLAGSTPLSVSYQEPIMVTALIDTIVSEKRMQFCDRPNVRIEADLSEGYGLFVTISPAELARVISNLVNNSVEAFGERPGLVTLTIFREKNKVELLIQDNGKGIPKDVLSRLGAERVSFGKSGPDGGSGLGVIHAQRIIEAAGGNLIIESEMNRGTKTKLVFPKAESPEWFVDTLKLKSGMTVVTVDDDQTIHQIWAGRLKSVSDVGFAFTHLSFVSIDAFEFWIRRNKISEVVYLVDFEYLRHKTSGLDSIERMGIAKNSILVTSRYEEKAIHIRASDLGVRMIPKGLAAYVPIEVPSTESRLHLRASIAASAIK